MAIGLGGDHHQLRRDRKHLGDVACRQRDWHHGARAAVRIADQHELAPDADSFEIFMQHAMSSATPHGGAVPRLFKGTRDAHGYLRQRLVDAPVPQNPPSFCVFHH